MTEQKNPPDMSPLFANPEADAEANAKVHANMVQTLFEHFDQDKDGYLNLQELAALQKATEGTVLTSKMYEMACHTLGCLPHQGIHLPALKLTYAAGGSDIAKDYKKVFKKKKKNKNEKPKEEEEDIIELGTDGNYDVSS